MYNENAFKKNKTHNEELKNKKHISKKVMLKKPKRVRNFFKNRIFFYSKFCYVYFSLFRYASNIFDI